LRNEVLLKLEKLSWITVNVTGSRATVIVRERIPLPEMFPEGVATAVYATGSGVVDQMMIWEGVPLVAVGDTVVIGQDLVSGRMDSIASGTRFVRADAQIYARTWYTLSMSIPLDFSEKTYTGSVSTKSTIFFGQSRINLFFDSRISYRSYDKIIEQSGFALPGGLLLPIRLERRIYTEYELISARLDEMRAAVELQERLLARLNVLIGPWGQILATSFSMEVAEGLVTVCLEAECLEQIAAIRRLSEDEMVIDNAEIRMQEVEIFTHSVP